MHSANVWIWANIKVFIILILNLIDMGVPYLKLAIEKKYGKPLKELLKEFYLEKGWSIYRIGRHIGVSPKTIFYWLKEFNMTKGWWYLSKSGEINPFYGKKHKKSTKLRKSLLSLKDPLSNLPKLNLSDLDRVWLACAIDTEGTITLGKNKRDTTFIPFRIFPLINISNKNLEFMEKFRNLVGGRYVISKGKSAYDLAINSESRVYAILKEIVDFLIIKKEQAQLVMKFIELKAQLVKECKKKNKPFWYTEEMLKIFKEVRELNGGNIER